MLTWIVIAVIVVALFILGWAVTPLLGRLRRLDRATRRLQLRQEQATGLQAGAETLTASLAGLQERAAAAEQRLAVIKAARGDHRG